MVGLLKRIRPLLLLQPVEQVATRGELLAAGEMGTGQAAMVALPLPESLSQMQMPTVRLLRRALRQNISRKGDLIEDREKTLGRQ